MVLYIEVLIFDSVRIIYASMEDNKKIDYS